MACDDTGRKRAYVHIWIIVVSCIIFVVLGPSASARSISTIQLGSYRAESGSIQDYDLAVKILNEEQRKSLRIKKVGKYYALRLGIFETYGEKEAALFKAVKRYYPGAILLDANLGYENLVRIYDPKAMEDVLQPTVELLFDPAGKLDSVTGKVPIRKPEPPVKVNQPVVTNLNPVINPTPRSELQAAEAAQAPQPYISDSVLIGFVTIVFLFMLELYIRTLARLGYFKCLRWLLAGSEESSADTEYVEAHEMGGELELAFTTGFIAPLADLSAKDTVLTTDMSGEPKGGATEIEAARVDQLASSVVSTAAQNAALSAYAKECVAGRQLVLTGDDSVAAEDAAVVQSREASMEVEDVSEMVSEDCPPIQSSNKKVVRPSRGERENRVDRAVLAVSFFAETEQ